MSKSKCPNPKVRIQLFVRVYQVLSPKIEGLNIAWKRRSERWICGKISQIIHPLKEFSSSCVSWWEREDFRSSCILTQKLKAWAGLLRLDELRKQSAISMSTSKNDVLNHTKTQPEPASLLVMSSEKPHHSPRETRTSNLVSQWKKSRKNFLIIQMGWLTPL